ncbi:hypothetical protein PHLCEN_2v7618 [Hermanssonia centrifuga]|uniref:Uncharacterized protein n=1 Tax=Hermanssonia centrifuga TaxID=98765 RepID=A0A2R6NVY9_9APHY|nr:hypothetical protein PHLCEN_2v7618 [Hermanssonia centrifuga]
MSFAMFNMPFLNAYKSSTRYDFSYALECKGQANTSTISPVASLVAYKAVFDLAAAKEELRQTKEDHAKLLGGCQARVEQQLAKKIALQHKYEALDEGSAVLVVGLEEELSSVTKLLEETRVSLTHEQTNTKSLIISQDQLSAKLGEVLADVKGALAEATTDLEATRIELDNKHATTQFLAITCDDLSVKLDEALLSKNALDSERSELQLALVYAEEALTEVSKELNVTRTSLEDEQATTQTLISSNDNLSAQLEQTSLTKAAFYTERCELLGELEAAKLKVAQAEVETEAQRRMMANMDVAIVSEQYRSHWLSEALEQVEQEKDALVADNATAQVEIDLFYSSLPMLYQEKSKLGLELEEAVEFVIELEARITRLEIAEQDNALEMEVLKEQLALLSSRYATAQTKISALQDHTDSLRNALSKAHLEKDNMAKALEDAEEQAGQDAARIEEYTEKLRLEQHAHHRTQSELEDTKGLLATAENGASTLRTELSLAKVETHELKQVLTVMQDDAASLGSEVVELKLELNCVTLERDMYESQEQETLATLEKEAAAHLDANAKADDLSVQLKAALAEIARLNAEKDAESTALKAELEQERKLGQERLLDLAAVHMKLDNTLADHAKVEAQLDDTREKLIRSRESCRSLSTQARRQSLREEEDERVQMMIAELNKTNSDLRDNKQFLENELEAKLHRCAALEKENVRLRVQVKSRDSKVRSLFQTPIKPSGSHKENFVSTLTATDSNVSVKFSPKRIETPASDLSIQFDLDLSVSESDI